MKRHVASLDALRGIAALSVVSLHLTLQTTLRPTPFSGHLAVDFFFVLSGYVIAGSYAAKLEESMTFRQFLKVRLIRLYPLVLLGLVIGCLARVAAFHAHGAQPDAPRSYDEIFVAFGLGLLLLPYLGGSAGIFPLDAPIWSLMFEIIANVVYVLIRPLGHTAFKAIVILSVPALAFCAFTQDGLSGGYTTATFLTGFPRVGFSFFIGVLIFHLDLGRRMTSLESVPFWIVCLTLLLSFFVPPWRFNWIYELVAVLFLYPVIVAVGSQVRVSRRLSGVALLLGRVSYPIYVLHDPLFAHLSHLHASHLFTACVIGLSLVAITGIGWAASALYDEPVRAWLTTRLSFEGRR